MRTVHKWTQCKVDGLGMHAPQVSGLCIMFKVRPITLNTTRQLLLSRAATNSSASACAGANASHKDKDVQMPTPLSDGFLLSYKRCDAAHTTATRRPLVIIAGWMGAKERQLKPYRNFYHERGYDTLSFAVGPKMVLQPDMAQKQMDEILQIAYIHNKEENTSSIHEPSCLLFHHFSVGGFLYGQALQAMSRLPELGGIKESIRAQIFDSPPDYMNIPTGISKSMGIGGPIEVLIEKSARFYLKLTENSAGVVHKAASHAFHENDVPCPSLWFYSKVST